MAHQAGEPYKENVYETYSDFFLLNIAHEMKEPLVEHNQHLKIMIFRRNFDDADRSLQCLFTSYWR